MKDTLNSSAEKRSDILSLKADIFHILTEGNFFFRFRLKFFDGCPIIFSSRQEHAASEEKRGIICLKEPLLKPRLF